MPPASTVGELWFDPCELVTMLVVPDVPEEETRTWAASARAQWKFERGWLSLRPVAKWQYAAFLRLARTRPRSIVHAPPIALLDPARLVAGAEDESVTGACVAEAALYWMWFGKLGATQDDWQDARRMLDDDSYRTLWGTPSREWGGGLSVQDAFPPITPDQIDIDYLDEFEQDEQSPPPQRRFFGRYEAPGNVAIRTAVAARNGLWTAPVSEGPIELVDCFVRDGWR